MPTTPAQLASLKTQPLPQALALARQIAGRGELPLIDLFTTAERLNQQQLTSEACDLYRLWLQSTASPVAYAAQFNYAVSLSNLERNVEAEQAYRASIAQKPDFIEAHLNLGTLLERLGRTDEAILVWNAVPGFGDINLPGDRALHVQAWNNLGRLLEIRKQFHLAEQMLGNSLLLDPKQTGPLTHWVHLRQKQCKWPVYQAFGQVSVQQMMDATSALALLSVSDDPALQLAAARRFVKEKISIPDHTLAPANGYRHGRLRVGYLSSDFCSHAVSILTAELYELHDRNKVELFAFSWSREDGSPLRARVVRAFEHYVPIHTMSDEQAAKCIREHEIDVLVDLHGLTSGTRPTILAYRPAPVQVTYLGFPGTTGLPNVDYVLADEFVLPPELAPHFSEKPLYLPKCFQINDRQREIGPCPTRATCGLPETGFIFCSFNNSFKFTPELFAAWMRILQRAPDSILWLVADDEQVRANLQNEAQGLGVAPERLIFAARVGPADYLARFMVADLFLDTFPFNGGTTASDALWAGLPLLTWSGRSFASRMAGSLLRAADLPELITFNLADYEEKAVQLAQQPERIAAMKRQLRENRLTCTLFDSPQFVREWENLLERIAVHPESQTVTDGPTTPAAAPAAPATLTTSQISPISLGAGSPVPTSPPPPHNVNVLSLMRNDFNMVVDVGCGKGGLAHAYRSINPQAHYVGIENSSENIRVCRAYCSEVIEDDVEHLPAATMARLAKAQCWVFDDALEQLHDPWALLRRVRRAATGPLEIVACISNAQHWGMQSVLNGGHLFYQDSGLLDRRHIRWFTRLTIFDLFRASGFQIANINAFILHQPEPEMVAALRTMALAAGNDPDQAVADASASQYLVRAVALPGPH
jgi:predicted O-linked N-acetylglucosamine transferase (SPINDLY family)/SAM-dependent methyltransferase